VSDSERERRRLAAELERLVGCVQTLSPSNVAYEKYPYMRAMKHWGEIAAVIKDMAEWLSLADKPNAFASKPWLQLQLSGDRRGARGWPIDDLVRDLSYLQKLLLTAQPQNPSNVPAGEPSREGARMPARQNQKYKTIDVALQEVAKSRPSTQEEVFRSLDGRRVVIPQAEPFTAADGWIAGFRRDPAAARAWLSKRWAQLNLPRLPRGPKTSKK
jgi:hypothetical protein